MTALVFSNFLPIPTFPVTSVGKANPPSYSNIRLFLYVCVLPQRNEAPGKGATLSMKATPKFHSVNDSLVTALENCCAEQIFERKIEKHNTDMIFFMSLNSLSSNIVIKTTGQENNGIEK